MRHYLLLCLIGLMFQSTSVAAQDEGFTNYQDVLADENAGVDRIISNFQHYYEPVTRKNMALLYWNLGALDVENNRDIDTYLRMTQCDIYDQYALDQFEWRQIRDKARTYLEKEAANFPVRFKYEQPLRLTEYDPVKEVFNVHSSYKIRGISRFEVGALDIGADICKLGTDRPIPGYPHFWEIILSQPMNLTTIPMGQERALNYIEDKMEDFIKRYKRAGGGFATNVTKEKMYEYRDAYIVMRFKAYAYKDTYRMPYTFENVARINVVLEGYEIYSDRQHTDLLFYKNFLREEGSNTAAERLKDQYQKLRKSRETKPDDAQKE